LSTAHSTAAFTADSTPDPEDVDVAGLRARIHQVDASVDGWFDQLRSHRGANRLFYTASALGDFGLIWVAFALLRAWRGRPGDDRAAVRALVATGVESVVVNAGIKSLFGRRRPVRQVEHPLPFRTPLTSSFPSGHATAAFCAAAMLSEDDPRAPLYYAAAVVVAASRVHVSIHHASDVIAGAAIGMVLGKLGKRLSPLRRASSPAD
jgi:undecaprenyl-diphosphatase